MTRPKVPFAVLFSVVTALMAPVVIVLLLFVSLGALESGPAWFAAVVLALALGGIVRPHLADLLALREYGGEESRRGHRDPPALTFPTAAVDLDATFARLDRMWNRDHKELTESVKVLKTILDRLPDPLFMLTTDRQILRSNRAAYSLLGSPPEGRNLAAMLRNPDVLETVDAVLAGPSGREGGKGRAVEFSLPVPISRSFRAWIEPLPEPASDGTVAILTLYDQSVEKRTKQLQADFIANASHELKTPLSMLSGYIETMRGTARDDEKAREKFLATMAEQAGRMGRLVDDLLILSRIELQEHMAPTKTVDLDHVLHGIADMLAPAVESRKQTIEFDLSEQPFVVGDGDQLIQVFLNLMDNAVKYGGDGSIIEVVVRPEQRDGRDHLAISVIDQGLGINPEQMPRLTERFYRTDAARSRELGGTGLGLAIVKHIVTRHQGDLAITSTPGEGSKFTVFLPVAPDTGA